MKFQGALRGDSVNVGFIRKYKMGPKLCFPKALQSFKKIVAEKRIFIGDHRLPVYEDLVIPDVFVVKDFIIKKNNCQNKLARPICDEDHEEKKSSTKQSQCYNYQIIRKILECLWFIKIELIIVNNYYQ